MLRAEPFLSFYRPDIDHRLIIFLSFFFFSFCHRFCPFVYIYIYIFNGQKRARVGNDWGDIIESSGNRILVFSFLSRWTFRKRRLLQLGLIKIDALEGERKRGSPLTQLLRSESIRALSVSMDLTLISFAYRYRFYLQFKQGLPSLRWQYASHNVFYITRW